MVQIPRSCSLRPVFGPTYSNALAGKYQIFSRNPSGGMTVTASGFFMSLPYLEKILLSLTPTDIVIPSSRFTRVRSVCARASPEVMSASGEDTST